MRAIEISAVTREKTERAPDGSRFSDALRAARRRTSDTGGAQRAEQRRAPRSDAPRRAGAETRPSEPRGSEGTREDRFGSPTGAPASIPLPARVAPEVASIARALPVAIAAACAAGDGALALSFGRSLDVELRVGRDGVDVVLHPEPRLLAAVSAELPRIVAALRARGVRVGSAEVRGRGREPRGGRRAR